MKVGLTFLLFFVILFLKTVSGVWCSICLILLFVLFIKDKQERFLLSLFDVWIGSGLGHVYRCVECQLWYF